MQQFCVEAADEPENVDGVLDEPAGLDGFGYNLPPEAVACYKALIIIQSLFESSWQAPVAPTPMELVMGCELEPRHSNAPVDLVIGCDSEPRQFEFMIILWDDLC